MQCLETDKNNFLRAANFLFRLHELRIEIGQLNNVVFGLIGGREAGCTPEGGREVAGDERVQRGGEKEGGGRGQSNQGQTYLNKNINLLKKI